MCFSAVDRVALFDSMCDGKGFSVLQRKESRLTVNFDVFGFRRKLKIVKSERKSTNFSTDACIVFLATPHASIAQYDLLCLVSFLVHFLPQIVLDAIQ